MNPNLSLGVRFHSEVYQKKNKIVEALKTVVEMDVWSFDVKKTRKAS